MTNLTIMQRREPVIWFEGTLMREPQSVGDGDPIGIDLTGDGLTIIAPLPRTKVRDTAPTGGATPSPSVPKDACGERSATGRR